MPEKTPRSGVGEAWLAQRESLWNPRGNLSLRIANSGQKSLPRADLF
jgi:hypothetical protein